MKDFSRHWVSSKSPRKQRKYRANAPLNIKRKMIAAHLSKELRQRYHTRALSVRKGDTVIIMRGRFKGSEGKIEKVYTKQMRVTLDSAKITSKKGTKIPIKIRPSALLIKELNMSDKLREKAINKYGKAR